MRAILIAILISLLMVVSCTEQQVSQYSFNGMETILSDENWEEITDIDTVYHLSWIYGNERLDIGNYTFCVNQEKVEYGVYLKNIQDLEEIFDGVAPHKPNAEYNCADSLPPFIVNSGIDFNERDYFVNFIQSGPLDFKRSIFINNEDKIVQYVVELKQNEHSGLFINLYWREMIGIPKIPDGYTVKIDTLNIPLQ